MQLDKEVSFRAVVACEDEAAAIALRDVLARMAEDAEASTTARFLGLVPALRARALTVEGRGAVLTTRADVGLAARVLAGLGTLLER